eukprot:CAMPEP_0169253392 /NCGR_PEP_ID=MMETSP1016-20121227/38581_1 /TAXON_ID=342587 /ORGANISM="Karlodinium micrum, Strain CCMP2283" /LENGTH=123 /DNA_ID=CAMNT_0009334711 /DNA_START=67 /DNA_END=438 /DNA_ORIENTATION=-
MDDLHKYQSLDREDITSKDNLIAGFLTKFNTFGWMPGMSRECDCPAVLGQTGSWLDQLRWWFKGAKDPVTPQCIKQCSKEFTKTQAGEDKDEGHFPDGPMQFDRPIQMQFDGPIRARNVDGDL